ncbi:hypothetical protein GTP45_04670 [Pseudoduganella sp. FT55W]|uniref:Uncharacterized protein n=1 Tax=Duganella rivi TaxID=2666083 RepID=A0A7X4KAE4_9BURK|nr:hypothetical protein [Duganella rivi]MYM66129.1 hypothetical protein [Duganella rivi]
MSTKRKRAVSAPPKTAKAMPPPAIDIELLLTLGEDRLRFDCEESDNVYFMAELIDPM